MSTSANRTLQIYKARFNILELLQEQGYDVDEYSEFSINEIDSMLKSSQLDMLVNDQEKDRKTYVKFYLDGTKQIRPQTLNTIIEDLFVLENILTKKDTLIIVTEDEPNETIVTRMKYLYDHDGIFVVIHNIQRLQYNMLKHELVPDCTILSKDDVAALIKEYNITGLTQLPEISRFDPHALALSIRPGDVCSFNRKSATALFTKYYRICI
uniref:RNA polymerase subunit H/Rpb5 C-terminal domain-containing protein n=1 Tax=viral metagenome TaxID=1070528 RepID=A0A6C0I3S7_9ZZZZ